MAKSRRKNQENETQKPEEASKENAQKNETVPLPSDDKKEDTKSPADDGKAKEQTSEKLISYDVQTPIKHDGQLYKKGDVLELPGENAQPLLRLKALKAT